MPEKKQPADAPQEPHGAPAVPEVEQPDPRSGQFQQEAQEEIEKEKLDP